MLTGLLRDFCVGWALPLNSRRLTVAVLIKRLATALELLVVGFKEELLAMIKRKLDSTGHEHQNVQVVVTVEEESEQACCSWLEQRACS